MFKAINYDVKLTSIKCKYEYHNVSLVIEDGYIQTNWSAKVEKVQLNSFNSVGRDSTKSVYSTISNVLQVTVICNIFNIKD